MSHDDRCCGTGTCIINPDGLCWCGQQWNGTEMCRASKPASAAPNPPLAQHVQPRDAAPKMPR